MDRLCDRNSPRSIVQLDIAQSGEREQLHGEIMKILTIPVFRFSDTIATRSSLHAVDFRDQFFGRISQRSSPLSS